MNKIYRIIWSKTRNCYMVVSELAKRNGKCSSSLNKKLIAAFLAAGTVLSVSGNAWAADSPADSLSQDEVTKLQQLLKYVVVKSTDTAASATGTGAVAAGPKASAEGDSSIAIGNGAKTKGDSTSIVIGKGVTNFSVNPTIIDMGEHISQSSIVIGGKSDTRTTQAHGGEYNIVMGYGSTIHGQDATPGQTASNSIAIGTNSEVISTDSSIVMGTNSFVHTDIKDSTKGPQRSNYGVAIGTNTQVITRDGSWSNAQYNISKDSNGKSATGIAIGYDSIAAQGSVTIGQHTLEGAFGDISNIQPYSVNRGSYGYFDYNTGVDNTTIGSNSFNDGNWSTIVGSYSLISDNYPGVSGAAGGGTKGVGATTVGSFNYNQNYKSTDGSSGVANTIMGLANTTDNSNTATIIGSGNTVKDSITAITDIKTVKDATSANDMQSKLKKMIKDSKGGSVSVVGNSNEVTNATLSQVMGVGNTVGSAKKAVVSSIAIGTGNTVTGSYSGAIGDPSTVSGDNSYAVGNNNTIEVEKGFILGNNATVTAAKSVALGDKSTAADAATVNGYDVTTGKAHVLADGEVASVWKATAGTVSVGGGTEGNEIVTRQITNVAAGSAETDAVNVAQLKLVAASVDGEKTHYYSVTDNNIHKSNYNNKGATGTDSMAAGIAAGTKGMLSTVTGSYSSIAAQTMLQGTGASAFGNFNNIGAADNAHDGIGNSVVGLANATNNANGALIFGTGNQITNSIDTLEGYNAVAMAYYQYTLAQDAYNADPTNATKEADAKRAYDTLQSAMKEFAKKAPEKGGDVLAIGGANKAYNAVKSSMIGVKNTIGKGSEETFEKNPVKFNSAIGYNNTIENGSNNSIIGTNRKISDKDGIIVIGSASSELTTSKANAVVIGTNANVEVENGVALGSDSVTAKVLSTTSGYDMATGKASTYTDAIWLPTLGEVSVGGNGATRRITNVAAGDADTDAVNVAQLKTSRVEIKAGDNITVATSVAKDGHAIYTLSSSPETVVAKGTNVTVDGPTSSTTGGDNVAGNDATSGGTTESGTYTTNTYTVNAVDTKYTAKQETVDGTDYKDGSTTFTVSEVDGKDVGAAKLIAGENVKITKGEDGSAIISAQAGGGMTEISFNGDNKDAQIDNPKVLNIEGGATGELTEGNIGVISDGEDTLTVKLAKDITDIDTITVNKTINVGDKTTIEGDKITVGDTTINNDGLTIKNGPSITKNGVDAGGKKITNVAPGTDDTDAVNVSQLREAHQDIYNSMNRLDDSTRKGIAGAAALAALHPLDFDPDDKWEFSAGVGNYRGETAAAIGAFYHPNDDTIFSLGATVGNGENLVNGGVTFRFGQKNHQSRSKKAMAKEIVELRAEVAELKALVYNMASGKMPGLDLTRTEDFPDTPENHWAYDYVSVLAGNGVLEGYPDGYFKGDRTLTRYEMAAIIYRAMMKGVDVDERMAEEFAPELARVKVDTLTSHTDGTPSIQRVRVIKGRE